MRGWPTRTVHVEGILRVTLSRYRLSRQREQAGAAAHVPDHGHLADADPRGTTGHHLPSPCPADGFHNAVGAGYGAQATRRNQTHELPDWE
ncbi:hypothetical protein SAM23877_7574 [Streptomyces ambofaciens ATCC 23877]|uniref:Uncharacterized protein n=1 Tax=Streptomyces ambofaciens (strain ATCC 23877 / 3486 / DSM 40053 / JCM 4204 / NBRC 12836 / NRRL B-2516) TaxID=278992 RepID=A0A0K2B5E8_STRA7|nr:hypothetical protein SAM23877_0099 [Streptomyces ambofaciens ATCC 23877]AKZ60615.1 hypothetical protein SAM23877_7574 [Streptomyces ambofaciens ATCC 23877]